MTLFQKVRENRIGNVMKKANSLQKSYSALNVPKTQNVRNPLPMRRLVKTVLPVLPLPQSMIACRKTVMVMPRRPVKGSPRSTRNTEEVLMPAADVYGADMWRKNGKTVEEIVEALQKRGFVATRAYVAMSLSIAKWEGTVSSVKAFPVKPDGRSTSRRLKYFMVW